MIDISVFRRHPTKRMLSGQGYICYLPNGTTVHDRDQRHFAVPVKRYAWYDSSGLLIAEADRLSDLTP